MAINPRVCGTPGTEQHEYYTARIGRKYRKLCSYDYRHTDGTLFSCIRPTLQACVDARDEWLRLTHRAEV